MSTVQVFDETNTTEAADLMTAAGDATGRVDASGQDQVNEDGVVNVTVAADHPSRDLLVPYKVLRLVGSDDVPRMAGFISSIRDRPVAPSHAGEIVEARATGLLGLWDEAVVEPWVGVGRLPFTQDRVFNVASPPLSGQTPYDDPAYGPSFVQTRGYAVTQGLEYPIGWTPEEADWIWSAADSETQPVGKSVFYNRFSFGDEENVEPMDLVFLVSADNDFELWLDGALLFRSPVQKPGYTWWDTYKVAINLPWGTHHLYAIAENWSTTGAANPAGFILSTWSTDGQQLTDPWFHTDVDWMCLHDQDPMPGFTPGRIVYRLFLEAQARGALPGWTLGFDSTEDSNGDPWPDEIPEFVCKVGESYRSVLRRLSESWVDVWADTEGLVLHMAAKSVGGRSQTSAVDLQPGVNIMSLTRTVSI